MPITPGLNLPFGIQPVNPVPVDSFYGPYANVAQAKASVPLALRYDGITVQITGSGNYWWLAADLSDSGLVPKVGGSGYEPDYITIGLNTAGELEVITPSEIITADNGLTKTLGNIQLGGNLLANTNIDGAFNLAFGAITPLSLYEIISNNTHLVVSDYISNTVDINITPTVITTIINDGSFVSTLLESANQSWLRVDDGANKGSYIVDNTGVLLKGQSPGGYNSTITVNSTLINSTVNLAFAGYVTTESSVTGYRIVVNDSVNNIGLDLVSIGVSNTDGSIDNHMIITDNIGSKGLMYADNYIPNFTNNSLITKLYADSIAGGSPPDNVTIILNTAGELVVANPYPGPQGLTSVLVVDNSTTGYDIVLTDTDQITSSSLSAALTLDDGLYGTSLSADGFDYGAAWHYNTGSYDLIYAGTIKNHSEIAAVDVSEVARARTVQYTTKGAIDAWLALDYINIESRASISIVKYDWTLDAWQGGLIYSAGGGTGTGWELLTTETYQKGLNIVNDLAFYLDGGSNASIDAAVDKVLVTKSWVLANAGVSYPPDNVTIILNTAGELTAVGAGAAGLPTVLGINNTTGANDISIDSTQKLTSTDGVNTINLAFNGGIAEWINFTGDLESKVWMQSSVGVDSQVLLRTKEISSGRYSHLYSQLNTIGSVNKIVLESNSGGEGLYTRLTISQQGNIIEDQINEMGISYAADYSVANSIPNNPRWLTDKDYVDTAISNVAVQIISPDDKFMSSLVTAVDNDLATNDTITNTPVDGCYVEVKYNGVEYEVGNGVKTKVFYFSGDGGVNARGFSSGHVNGQVQTGDELYFNGSVAGFQLEVNFRISLMYLITI